MVSPQPAQAIVIARLGRQVWEKGPQALTCVPEPSGFTSEPEQGLQDGEVMSSASVIRGRIPIFGPKRNPFGIRLQHVTGFLIQCGSKGVQIGVHAGLQVRRLGLIPPILGTFAYKNTMPRRDNPLEIFI